MVQKIADKKPKLDHSIFVNGKTFGVDVADDSLTFIDKKYGWWYYTDSNHWHVGGSGEDRVLKAISTRGFVATYFKREQLLVILQK
jgi:hypothetical protein